MMKFVDLIMVFHSWRRLRGLFGRDFGEWGLFNRIFCGKLKRKFLRAAIFVLLDFVLWDSIGNWMSLRKVVNVGQYGGN